MTEGRRRWRRGRRRRGEVGEEEVGAFQFVIETRGSGCRDFCRLGGDDPLRASWQSSLVARGCRGRRRREGCGGARAVVSVRAGRGVVPGELLCRARRGPGGLPPGVPAQGLRGRGRRAAGDDHRRRSGVALSTAVSESSTRRKWARRCAEASGGAHFFTSWGLGLGAGQVRRARARARGARGVPERGWAAPAGAQRDVGRACCARTKARPRGLRAADGRGRAWEMMAPSRARRRARGGEAGPLPCAGGACGRSGRGDARRRRSRRGRRRGLRFRGAAEGGHSCLEVTGGGARPPARPRARAGPVRTRLRAVAPAARGDSARGVASSVTSRQLLGPA